MDHAVKCSCKENHKAHICELFRSGQIETMELCTDDPFYSCIA